MKKLIRFLPSIIWMSFIFYLSSKQTTGIGGNSYYQRFFILKTFHLIEYAVLFILLFYANNLYRHSFYLSAIYALSDEFHQFFTIGRLGTIRDVFIDLFGALIGAYLVSKLLKINWIKKFIFIKKVK